MTFLPQNLKKIWLFSSSKSMEFDLNSVDFDLKSVDADLKFYNLSKNIWFKFRNCIRFRP